MRKFIYKVFLFLLLIIGFTVLGLFLPTTPRASKSLLMVSVMKDSLLKNTKSPRIIFVGGSNLSFGLNSQMLKDSLKINPINTGIHAGIGLQYMIENTLRFVKKGDIIVLIPEYEHFYLDYDAGSEELLRIVFDVDISNLKLLNMWQLGNIVSLMPKYATSKLNPTEYFNVVESDVYSVNSFNKYGDAVAHYGMKRRDFPQTQNFKNEFNNNVMEKLKKFQLDIEKKGANLIVSYPAFQDLSYANCEKKIKRVQKEFEKNNFSILGTPERYKCPDVMMFNTPSHLNKQGVDYRTKLFIEDFEKSKSFNL